jgi:hypothetical protein
MMSGSLLSLARVPTIAVLVLAGGTTLLGQRGARTSVNRNVSRTSVNRSVDTVNANRNVNRNVSVNRDVDIDVDRHYGGWGEGCCYHPVATAAAVTAAAVTTAAVIGSVVHALPPSCSAVNVNGVTFQQCGSTWYQPQFVGTTVNYVVVNPPR